MENLDFSSILSLLGKTTQGGTGEISQVPGVGKAFDALYPSLLSDGSNGTASSDPFGSFGSSGALGKALSAIQVPAAPSVMPAQAGTPQAPRPLGGGTAEANQMLQYLIGLQGKSTQTPALSPLMASLMGAIK